MRHKSFIGRSVLHFILYKRIYMIGMYKGTHFHCKIKDAYIVIEIYNCWDKYTKTNISVKYTTLLNTILTNSSIFLVLIREPILATSVQNYYVDVGFVHSNLHSVLCNSWYVNVKSCREHSVLQHLLLCRGTRLHSNMQ